MPFPLLGLVDHLIWRRPLGEVVAMRQAHKAKGADLETHMPKLK